MLLAAEARKHRALREVPVALVLALVYFILNAEPQNPVQDQRTLWFLTCRGFSPPPQRPSPPPGS